MIESKDVKKDYSDSWIQRNANKFWAGLKYLDEIQLKAIDGLIPMDQKIFDSIMKKQIEVGSELKELCIDISLEYEEFLIHYYLERAIEIEKKILDQPVDVEKTKNRWKALRKRIKESMGEDIGEFR